MKNIINNNKIIKETNTEIYMDFLCRFWLLFMRSYYVCECRCFCCCCIMLNERIFYFFLDYDDDDSVCFSLLIVNKVYMHGDGDYYDNECG